MIQNAENYDVMVSTDDKAWINIYDNINGGHIEGRNPTVTLRSPPATTQISSFNSFSETPAARQ